MVINKHLNKPYFLKWAHKCTFASVVMDIQTKTMKLITNTKTKNVYIVERYDKHITGFTTYKQEYLTGPNINGTLMIQYV